MSEPLRESPRPPVPAKPEEEFLVSNSILLSGRQLAGLGLLATALILLLPAAWERFEPLAPAPDDRIPYELSTDYWLWKRMARRAADEGRTILLGDSVVWGQYVSREETLSHWLDREAADRRFANLGVDGMHPAALAGLVEHYAAGIAAKRVVVHMNPLWLSERRLDLRGEDEFRFNHPALVPQFVPSIPCYRESVSQRLGLVVERNVPFYQWVSHLQQAYLGSMSLPQWTLEHPRELPLGSAAVRLGTPEGPPRHRPVPWTEQGIRKQSFAWVDLETSFQWRSFREAVETLRARGNRVFVVVGPFNEHLLTEAGRTGYARIRDGVAAWLRERGIPHDVPPCLPSELYADASHPLAEGYRMLARRVFPLLSD